MLRYVIETMFLLLSEISSISVVEFNYCYVLDRGYTVDAFFNK